jgi:hypothetical protein
MIYTFDKNGSVTIEASWLERAALHQLADIDGTYAATAEVEALGELACESELRWIETSTHAPVIGIIVDGTVTAAWCFLDYTRKSFAEELAMTGKVVFAAIAVERLAA